MISPCYQCEKRQEDCHDSCAEYQEFRQMMRDINHIRKRELHYDYMVIARQQRAKKEPSRIVKKNGGYRKGEVKNEAW
jgi:hypothetical protein